MAEWRTLKGEPHDILPSVARRGDLTLFTASSARYTTLFENLLEVTLLRSGRPVLFVPEGASVARFRQPLVAGYRLSRDAPWPKRWISAATDGQREPCATSKIAQGSVQAPGQIASLWGC